VRVLAVLPFFFLSSFGAHAADLSPEVYLPETVRGVLLTGPLERKGFQFAPAKVQECERTEVLKMVLYRCKASGGQLRIDAGTGGTKGSDPKIDFTGVNVFYKTQKDGSVLREYHYLGTWTETVVGAAKKTAFKWVVWRWNDAAPDYHGFLELSDWGYSARLLGDVR
jgi:hypothetical protein